jgi:hypothetical protein
MSSINPLFMENDTRTFLESVRGIYACDLMYAAAGMTGHMLKTHAEAATGKHVLPKTRSGKREAMYQVPCPPFEWPTMTTFDPGSSR